jgi:hypothetical protein
MLSTKLSHRLVALFLPSALAFVCALVACTPLLAMARIKHTTRVSDDETHPEVTDTASHEVAEVLLTLNKNSLEAVVAAGKPSTIGKCRIRVIDEVVVFEDLFVTGLRMLPHTALADMLQKIHVQLHQLTSNGIVQLSKFFWVVSWCGC